jgi:Ca2+-binding RTX toxin-like protein
VKGIAITGFTSQHGHWEYSINNGTSWTAFGAYSLSSGLLLTLDDKVRFVPDGDHGGSNTLTYVAWDQTTTATHGQTTSISGGLHSDPFSQGSQTATLTVTDVNDAPVLNVMNHYVVETFDPPGPSATYTSTIHNLIASDVDGGDFESFTLTATAEHGTLSLAGSGSGVVVSNSGPASLTVSGLLGSLNDALAQGVSYTSGLNDANVEQVTAVLTDSHGAFDTVNFIFPQHGSGLSGVVDVHGTAGRDVITSNFGSNNLWGEAGNDVFVFKGMLGNDTIEDFHHGEDLIALAQSGIADFADLLAHTTDVSGNAVIANPLVGSGSITITGVEKAQLAASDFHFVV